MIISLLVHDESGTSLAWHIQVLVRLKRYLMVALLISVCWDSSPAGFRGGHCWAGHVGRGVIQGQYSHHAVAKGQSNPLDLRHAGLLSLIFNQSPHQNSCFSVVMTRLINDHRYSYNFITLFGLWHQNSMIDLLYSGADGWGLKILWKNRRLCNFPATMAENLVQTQEPPLL